MADERRFLKVLTAYFGENFYTASKASARAKLVPGRKTRCPECRPKCAERSWVGALLKVSVRLGDFRILDPTVCFLKFPFGVSGLGWISGRVGSFAFYYAVI